MHAMASARTPSISGGPVPDGVRSRAAAAAQRFERGARAVGRGARTGLLLTGGNTLTAYGGDAPERDRTELDTLAFARARGVPVLGVCRGMQVILHAFGVPLRPVDGHAGTRHRVGGSRTVNSFHDFGSTGDTRPLDVLARADDGVVEAMRHPVEPVHGVMWHPERCEPFAEADVRLFRQLLSGGDR